MADNCCVRQRWEDVNKEIGVDVSTATRWWCVIRDLYSEPHRYYHTLNHLEEMFGHFDQTKEHVAFSQTHLVTLAIFFHDLIYEPKKADNEEKSAEKFLDYAREICVLSRNDCQTVKDWILLTKTHAAGKGDNSSDEHYFLDIDMAVLGRPDTEYDKYASQIRKEYIHIPEETYRQRRAEVLEDFLTRLPLFSTSYFQNKLEEQAKNNLTREIQRLRDVFSNL